MHSSVGDCWKGLRIRSTPKHLQNWEAVGVQRMLKVSKVGVGKLQDAFRVENRLSLDRAANTSLTLDCA